MIGFFSSQQRQLYIEDIYKVLAFPKQYVIQFRYQETDIDNDIRRNIMSAIGDQGIIFYSVTEDLGLRNIPVRQVKVIDVYVSEELGYVNFYLELGDFVNCEISDGLNTPSQFPPNTFVSNIIISQISSEKWVNLIERIKPYFKQIKFIYIKSIKSVKNRKIKMFHYNRLQKRSFLILDDEEEYVSEVLTYDKTSGSVQVDITKDDKVIDLSGGIPKGNEVDTSFIRLNTRAIEFRNQSSSLAFSSKDEDDAIYKVELLIEVKRKWSKSIFFGVMTMIGAGGLLLGTYFAKTFAAKEFYFYTSLAAVFIGVSAGGLHWLFNKK
ncbi:hypothetical protein QNH28_03540 [Paenibacillus sp. G2S3]|uniref:hypothetical protein n=1 Tax=Paenibacillus sp. G2S3 TaxID=3047872 RepID=UPI0024C117FE|nr:hypothetical protein [Paenibacillus sp. G2S3]WHY20107.1 hypothetical protein QNH28_03540 [Paenibacillus sp. G2S3]